jgi:hypothetical protein
MHQKNCCSFACAHPKTWVHPEKLGALAVTTEAGRPDGWAVAFYQNQQKAYEGRYDEGLPVGWWVFYGEDGNVAAAHLFEGGRVMRCMQQNMRKVKEAAPMPAIGLAQAA